MFRKPFWYLLSYFLQTLYGMADLFITGQFYGVDSITAVANGSQVMHMITVILVGLAMGATVIIGRAVGGNRMDEAGKAVGNTVTLFMVLAAALMAVLLCLARPIVILIGTPEEAVAETVQYLVICFLGIPFITAYKYYQCHFPWHGRFQKPHVLYRNRLCGKYRAGLSVPGRMENGRCRCGAGDYAVPDY